MQFKLKISTQNQITLPKNLISELGASSGKYIYINKDETGYYIQNTKAEVDKAYGFLAKKVNPTKKLKSGVAFETALEKSKISRFKNK
ncbi:MAG: hypothetical protein AAGF07_01775 [Patescibacteria group bacterium]